MKRLRAKPMTTIDTTKPLHWALWTDARAEFQALVKRPPLGSVVVKIWPDVAENLLKQSKTLNRDTRLNAIDRLSERVIKAGEWEMTGDTIKIDRSGNLIDGHHRLMACVESKKSIISHVVFGLHEKVFDVIDSGGAGSRTAADALGISGVGDPKLVSGALNFIRKYDAGAMSGNDSGQKQSLGLLPREARQLFEADFSDLTHYTANGRALAKVTHVPPSIITGVLYIIGRGSNMNRKRADEFAEAWLSDIRTGPNENFKLFYQRCQVIKSQAGMVTRGMYAALTIQVFNYWNSNLVIPAKALNWKPHLVFPKVYVKSSEFLAKIKLDEFSNTALTAETARVILALQELVGKDGVAIAKAEEISRISKVSPTKIKYLVRSAERSGLIGVVTEPMGQRAGAYTITSAGRKALKTSPLGQALSVN